MELLFVWNNTIWKIKTLKFFKDIFPTFLSVLPQACVNMSFLSCMWYVVDVLKIILKKCFVCLFKFFNLHFFIFSVSVFLYMQFQTVKHILKSKSTILSHCPGKLVYILVYILLSFFLIKLLCQTLKWQMCFDVYAI